MRVGICFIICISNLSYFASAATASEGRGSGKAGLPSIVSNQGDKHLREAEVMYELVGRQLSDDATQVVLAIWTIAGTTDIFQFQTLTHDEIIAIDEAVASAAGVETSQVSLAFASASGVVYATITGEGSQIATIASAVSTKLGNASNASAAFGVTVVAAAAISVTTASIAARTVEGAGARGIVCFLYCSIRMDRKHPLAVAERIWIGVSVGACVVFACGVFLICLHGRIKKACFAPRTSNVAPRTSNVAASRALRSYVIPGGTVQAHPSDGEGLVGLTVGVPRNFWSAADLAGHDDAFFPCPVVAECVREFRHPDGERARTYLISHNGQYFPIKRRALMHVCLSAAQRAQLSA